MPRDNIPIKLEDFNMDMCSLRKNDKTPSYPMCVDGADGQGWKQYLIQVRPPKDGGRLMKWSLSDGVFMGQRKQKFTISVTQDTLNRLKALAAKVPEKFLEFNPNLVADQKTGEISDMSRALWYANHQPFAHDPSPSNVKKGADGKFLTPYHLNLKEGETVVTYHQPIFSVNVEVETAKNDRKIMIEDIPGRVVPTSMFLERKRVLGADGKWKVAQVNVPVEDMWNPSKEPDKLTGARWDMSGFKVVSLYFRFSPYLTGKFGFSPKLHSVLLERAPIGGNEAIPFIDQEDDDAAWLAAAEAAAAEMQRTSAPPTDEEMMAALAAHDAPDAPSSGAGGGEPRVGGRRNRNHDDDGPERPDAPSSDAPGGKRKRDDDHEAHEVLLNDF
jgi:hypothetical protein